MSNDQKNISGGGVGIGGMLGIVFIVLKLTGTITWPWLWVLSPFWIPIVLALGIIGIILIVVGIAGLITYKLHN